MCQSQKLSGQDPHSGNKRLKVQALPTQRGFESISLLTSQYCALTTSSQVMHSPVPLPVLPLKLVSLRTKRGRYMGHQAKCKFRFVWFSEIDAVLKKRPQDLAWILSPSEMEVFSGLSTPFIHLQGEMAELQNGGGRDWTVSLFSFPFLLNYNFRTNAQIHTYRATYLPGQRAADCMCSTVTWIHPSCI